MTTRDGGTGPEPEFRWVVVGRRARLSLVRRVAVPFELRAADGDRLELWIHIDEQVRRWRLPGRVPTAGPGSVSMDGVASELAPLPGSVACAAPPPWDAGRCVLEVNSRAQLRFQFDSGPLAFSLHGARVRGCYRLDRTPLEMDGRAQWVVLSGERSPVPAESR